MALRRPNSQLPPLARSAAPGSGCAGAGLGASGTFLSPSGPSRIRAGFAAVCSRSKERNKGSGRGLCCGAAKFGARLVLSGPEESGMAASRSDDDVVIIKKYANRRLYDTESSSYITLDKLAHM